MCEWLVFSKTHIEWVLYQKVKSSLKIFLVFWQQPQSIEDTDKWAWVFLFM